jgi:hypothetical protein
MSAIGAARDCLEAIAHATPAEREAIAANLRGPASIIDQLHNCRAMLVYQSGLANVFQVASFNLADYGRYASRMMQSDFRNCESFALGLAAAGWIVKTAACNMAGDAAAQQWTDDLESQPFSSGFRPVDSDKIAEHVTMI